jgi:molybdopterin converting factor small subunit
MIKIKLRLSSWVAAKLGDENSGWLTLEEEVGEGSTISDLLAGIVKTYPGLREAVYSPDTGLVDKRINVALNDLFLNSREISQVKLSDGDTVFLFPSHWGG